MDYSDWPWNDWPWNKKKEFTLNDAENQEEEEKGMLKSFIAKVKNMLHKLGKRN